MISIRLDDDGRPLLERIIHMPDRVRNRLVSAMTAIGGEMQSRMFQRMSAQLKPRSRKLERAFYHVVSQRQGGNLIVLTTGVRRRAFYAAFQDKGVRRKSVDVRAYTRGVKSRNVRGRGKTGSSGVGFVSAYRREMYLNPRPFIGIVLEEMRARIMADLRAAVNGGLGGP